jgi:hypothetical protein
MATRVPAIIDRVLEANAELSATHADAVRELSAMLRQGGPLPPLGWPEQDGGFAAALALRRHESWHSTDWFFAETYAYRRARRMLPRSSADSRRLERTVTSRKCCCSHCSATASI